MYQDRDAPYPNPYSAPRGGKSQNVVTPPPGPRRGGFNPQIRGRAYQHRDFRGQGPPRPRFDNWTDQHSRGGPRFNRGGGRGHNSHFRGHNPNQNPRMQANFNPTFNKGPRQQHNFQHQQNDHGKNNPWMTPQLLALIQEKDELWNTYDKNRTEENHRHFKIKRHEVSMAVNDAKIMFNQKNPVPVPQTKPVSPKFKVPDAKPPEFYCNPCDKEFKSLPELDTHKTEHITCKLDGCTYTAHAKLVMKHIELQHSTNLFQRIKGYDTPEGIEKWKEERKKNWPTPININRKRAERDERKSRGETLHAEDDLLDCKVFRYKIIPEHQKRKPNFRRRGPASAYQSEEEVDFPPKKKTKLGETLEENFFSIFNHSPVLRLVNFYTDIQMSENGTVVGFSREKWIKDDQEDNNELTLSRFHNAESSSVEFNITDDEIDEPSEIAEPAATENSFVVEHISQKQKIKEITEKSNVGYTDLLGLGGYSSDTEQENQDAGKDIDVNCNERAKMKDKQQSTTSSTSTPLAIVEERLHSSDDEAPEEIPVIKSVETPDSAAIKTANTNPSTAENKSKEPKQVNKRERHPKQNNKKGTIQQNCVNQAKNIKRKYTLLQRLLAPDIRREKNMVLQVCRFLVDNHFLDQNTKEEIFTQNDDKTPLVSSESKSEI